MSLRGEYNQQDVEDAATLHQHDEGNRAKRLKLVAKRTQVFTSLPQLHGLSVFLERGAAMYGLVPSVADCVVASAMTMVAHRADAGLFVADPGSMTLPTQMALALMGGIVCDHACLASKGERGSMLQYKQLTRSRPRSLWVSDKFKLQHVETWDVVAWVVPQKCCPFKEVTKECFAAFTSANLARPARQRRTVDVVGLVTDKQKASEALHLPLN